MTATEYAAMIEAARQEGREEGERLLQATVDNLLDGEQERLARVHADGVAEGERLGVAKAAEVAEGLHYASGKTLATLLRKSFGSDDALTRLIAEKQAEALNLAAQDVALHCPCNREEDDLVEEWLRERAAAYRKGGAP